MSVRVFTLHSAKESFIIPSMSKRQPDFGVRWSHERSAIIPWIYRTFLRRFSCANIHGFWFQHLPMLSITFCYGNVVLVVEMPIALGEKLTSMPSRLGYSLLLSSSVVSLANKSVGLCVTGFWSMSARRRDNHVRLIVCSYPILALLRSSLVCWPGAFSYSTRRREMSHLAMVTKCRLLSLQPLLWRAKRNGLARLECLSMFVDRFMGL